MVALITGLHTLRWHSGAREVFVGAEGRVVHCNLANLAPYLRRKIEEAEVLIDVKSDSTVLTRGLSAP